MEKLEKEFENLTEKLRTVITKSADFDEAIRKAVRLLVSRKAADYACVWYLHAPKADVLYPYYWISPVDLTAGKYPLGSGAVGRAVAENAPVCLNDFGTRPDPQIRSDYEGVEISSVICVPFGDREKAFGCVQWLKTSGPFDNESRELCRTAIRMAETLITPPFFLPEDKRYDQTVIAASGIKKAFKSGDRVSRILNGVNFNVYDGEFLCLLGESGCGKTTMLNIIGGMDRADAGRLQFMDKDLSHASQKALTRYRRNHIGFIFQSYNLMPNLNAKQNLDLIAELVKDPMSSEEALALVGLQEKSRLYPSQLSGGQQQRVSIARALVKKPQVILADEPTAALDYATSIEVLKVLEDVVAAGTTLVMVTHNEEITRMANRVIRFRGGKTYEISINSRTQRAEDLIW